VYGILIGAIGNTIGNMVLYKLIHRHSDFLNSKIAKLLNIDLVKLDYYMKQIETRGVWWLVVGKCVPSLKVLVPILVGLSDIGIKKAVSIFFLGSLLWATLVTYLGYHFGKSANLIQFYLIVICIYIAIGLLTSYRMKQNSKDNKK
jgi:membrane protein DedA with SNARE-associated domain